MQPALGIDVGGTTVSWAVLAGPADDRIVAAQNSIPTGRDRTEVLRDLVDLAGQAEAAYGVLSVGVGVPGHVDRSSGIVRFLPNLPGRWAGFPLGSFLTRDTGLPVNVLNDARAFCLAELARGAAQEHRDILFLTLGTGVGGGVATNGRLLVDQDDRLGEIGHLIYEREGRPCGCGAAGCLETYASGPGLVATMTELSGRRPSNAAEVFAAAEAGDALAQAATAVAGRAIGETIASLCAVLPASLLVIGGGVAAGLPHLRPEIERALSTRRAFIGPVEVVAAHLGTAAGAIGAALAAENEHAAATVAVR